jgi:hypothetical protein
VPLPFVATLELKFGALATFTASGSGIGSSEGGGGTASIPAGTFSLRSTQVLDPPLLNLIPGMALARPGQSPVPAPLPGAGANRAFTFDGAERRCVSTRACTS